MRLAFALLLIASLASIACGSVIARKYEYEEEIFLALDGSATVYVNASVPALVALRGVALPLDPRARLDRTVVRDLYESAVSHVASVTTSRREGRRYVHLRLTVPDVRRLGEAPPFAWSKYQYHEQEGQYEFTQTMGAAANQSVGSVGWDGGSPSVASPRAVLRIGSSAPPRSRCCQRPVISATRVGEQTEELA